MSDTIPLWARERALELSKSEWGGPFLHTVTDFDSLEYPGARAFARYIAAHEEAPVDPVESIFNSGEFSDRYDMRSGVGDAEVFRAELAKRGLEIRPVQS